MDAPALSAFGGILSASETDNPDFHKWNMVKFLYCDGSSYLAGGIGAFIYGDFSRDKLSSVESLHVLLDGAMFPDQPSYTGEHIMANLLKKTFYFHNIKGLNQIKYSILY
ncbi:Hypothetical predicted protein [Mytilus galloprovincialis]|uniref:Uncharacterized protein n=1 Tax=Mytilus galloprovincialis TaxID=29158 RepID=A0A8B6HPT1_MYTGA|nr:Hypothetical predicted protein [Mytilus galloprovincialis]